MHYKPVWLLSESLATVPGNLSELGIFTRIIGTPAEGAPLPPEDWLIAIRLTEWHSSRHPDT